MAILKSVITKLTSLRDLVHTSAGSSAAQGLLVTCGMPAFSTLAAVKGNTFRASCMAFHSAPPAMSGGSLCTEPPRKQVVAVAISGGVDSAVAALLLKQQGHEVFGVFMRTWDEAEEQGNGNCSVEADLRDAQRVCQELHIPLHKADFVNEYWNKVFSDFVSQCERGLTPNPDLACNRHIKFNSLLRFATGLGADAVATGHHARLQRLEDGSVQLLRGVDSAKDQSYFLASVRERSLRNVIFPVGHFTKAQVRGMAEEAGLSVALRRSSAGICFIGRRNFADFLGEYTQSVPGGFVDVDSDLVLGSCPNLTAVTNGQRASIGGAPDRMYIVGKDVLRRRVYVALGPSHPALFASTALLHDAHWVADLAPESLRSRGVLQCQYKARYRQVPESCTVSTAEPGVSFQGSRYCRLLQEDMPPYQNALQVDFGTPARALTPQQALVMYDGDVCLGSAPIGCPGLSLYEAGHEALVGPHPYAASMEKGTLHAACG